MNTQCSLVYLYLQLQLKSSDRLHSFNPYGTAKPPFPPPPTPTSKENQLFSWLSADVQSTPFIAGTIGTSKSESRNSGSLFQSNICNSFLPGIQLLSILQGCPLQRGTSGGSRPSDKGGGGIQILRQGGRPPNKFFSVFRCLSLV